jgi:probable O-glycosylation ligase (exosortase A-associated)
MRDALVLIIILGSVPFCFRQPFFGVLMWTWVAYFNPHRYTWTETVYNFPVAMVVAIPTLLGLLFARKMNRDILTRESLLIFLLWVWMCITLVYALQVPLFAGHIQDGADRLVQITKILLMTFVTMLVVNSPHRLRQLVLVISLSLGVRAVWAGIFGIRTGGEFRVYGPHDSFLGDNNDFALALNMVLPLLYFLIPGEPRRWARNGLWLCFFASILCVVLTYSRGGLLGLATVLFLLAMMSRYRIPALLMVGAAALLVVSFAPQAWTDRMDKMAHGEVDSSMMQRLIAWRTGWNLAMDYPITGGGLEAYPDVAVFKHYQPEEMPGGRESSGPHSIYFQVLGELGFPGLLLFVLLLGSCFLSIRGLRHRARRRDPAHWAILYSRMFEVSLAAFAVSGAFLGRAYFDLWYEIVACIVVLRVLYRREEVELRKQIDVEVEPELSPVQA